MGFTFVNSSGISNYSKSSPRIRRFSTRQRTRSLAPVSLSSSDFLRKLGIIVMGLTQDCYTKITCQTQTSEVCQSRYTEITELEGKNSVNITHHSIIGLTRYVFAAIVTPTSWTQRTLSSINFPPTKPTPCQTKIPPSTQSQSRYHATGRELHSLMVALSHASPHLPKHGP